MISNRKYILHTESESEVNQWHFSNAKILTLLLISLIVLGSFLLIGADYVSKLLYDKRLKEFKANYSAVILNIDVIQSRLKELDQQILDIEEKDKAVRTYAGMPEVDKDIRKLGIGGETLKEPHVLDNLAPAVSKEISELHLDIERLSRQVNFELASYETIYDRVKSDINRIDNIRRFHQGQDITVPSGAPIFSPADGVVKRAYYIGGFGNHIKLEHSSGYSTTFAHLSKIFVRHGQKIKRGTIIGETGNTGRSTAPHLHYEVHYRGTPKNPLDYFFTQAGN